MKKNIVVYAEDILAAIKRIETYTKSGNQDFTHNPLVQDAVLRQLSIIGEAASKFSPAMRKKYKDIPWKEVIGLRNVIIHDYSEVNITRVWETITKDLPSLRKSVQMMRKDLKA